MKKILISLSIIGVVGAIAVGGTIAYFSDTETSTGNTFTAGSIDLQFKVQGENGEWTDVLGQPLFALSDMKPGDTGEKTVNLVVDNNPACGKVDINLTSDLENSCTEPEIGDEPNCAVPGDGGELNDNVKFIIWKDNGVGETGVACDNKMNGDETTLLTGTLESDHSYSIGELPNTLDKDTPDCYGIAYCFGTWDGTTCDGSSVDNSSQSDSFTANMIITALQERNQYPSGCPDVGNWPTQPI